MTIMNTGYTSTATIEMTWALILASARHVTTENDDLAGKTLGVIGLGNVGSQVAKIGLAFGMEVIS